MAAEQRKATVKSHIPGRLRLKFPAESCSATELCQIRDELKGRDGVQAVEANESAGSVTITYDPHRHSMSGILGVLQDLRVVVGEIAGEKGGDSGGTQTPTFLEAVDDLNRQLSAATGLAVDLKMAIPLALLGMGMWSALRQGLTLQKVPALVFFWGAFDTFVRLHPPQVPSPPRPSP